jgi:hypothetical protein
MAKPQSNRVGTSLLGEFGNVRLAIPEGEFPAILLFIVGSSAIYFACYRYRDF